MTELFALGIAAMGLFVTMSWIVGFDAAKSLFSATVTMKFSTSVSFLASGFALFATSRHLTTKEGSHILSQIVLPSSLLIILLFMTTHISSMLLSTPSGLDNLFVEEEIQTLDTVAPGRPSLGTISNFILIVAAGVTTLAVSSSIIRNKILFCIGSAIGIIGTLAISGYALASPLLYYSIPNVSTAMAVHTAILFGTFGFTLALLARHQDKSHAKKIVEKIEEGKQVSIRTRLITLFLVVSVMPIVFIGAISLNNSRTLPSEVLGGSVAVLGITAILSATLFAFILLRSIVNPIRSLRNAANLIAAGNYETQLPVGSLDELGQLAIDLGKMKETIVSNNKNLERLVELRTVELADSNKQLELANKQLTIANEQLRLHGERMQDFVNVAAHELRNPITPILMATSMLEGNQQKRNSEDITLNKDEFGMIVRNAERLKRLAEDILDVTKIENQSLQLTKERFDLSILIASVIQDSRKIFGSRNVDVSYQVPTTRSGVILVVADRDKIFQVISNLLINASKFTSNGSITIIAEVDNSNRQVLVSVRDTGNGIDLEILPQLFTKFATKSNRGMGLGLYISKSIIESHGGKIWAHNNKIEKGATFTFSLPVSKDE